MYFHFGPCQLDQPCLPFLTAAMSFVQQEHFVAVVAPLSASPFPSASLCWQQIEKQECFFFPFAFPGPLSLTFDTSIVFKKNRNVEEQNQLTQTRLTRTNFTFPLLKFTLITRTSSKNIGR